MTTVYYRGSYAHITEDLLEVWTPEHHAFRIEDLNSVYVVSGARRGPLLLLLSLVAVVVAAMLSVVGAHPALLVVAALVAVGSITLAACLRTPAPPYELHALHHGTPVRLFRSADSRTFGQIQRALMRAIEEKTRW